MCRCALTPVKHVGSKQTPIDAKCVEYDKYSVFDIRNNVKLARVIAHQPALSGWDRFDIRHNVQLARVVGKKQIHRDIVMLLDELVGLDRWLV